MENAKATFTIHIFMIWPENVELLTACNYLLQQLGKCDFWVICTTHGALE